MLAEDAAQHQAEALTARAVEAEQAGKTSVARLYYEQAARRLTGAQREELLARARALQRARPASRTAAVR